MPELPDVQIYVEHLTELLMGRVLERARLGNPFVLRTFDPPLAALEGRAVRELRRIGKRIVLGFEAELFLVVHLMIAGRLRWTSAGAVLPKRVGLAALDFPSGTLILTEAGTTRRASLHLVHGAAGLADFDRGGVEPLEVSSEAFASALTAENRTLKRALTDPRLVSGIGNAYSDEILFRAKLSPVRLTRQLEPTELERLHRAVVETLREWTDRLRAEASAGFPQKVTAFRPEMAVHGRYREPCRVCATPVQRIRYANNEANYCPRCQTGGKLLADRGLSRLLKTDWPKSIEELEERLGKSE